MNMEKVIKGLEEFKADLKPFCGGHADWEKFDAGLSLLKKHKEKMEHLNNITLEYEKEVFRLQALLKEKDKRINELEEKLRLLEYGDLDTLQSTMMPAT